MCYFVYFVSFVYFVDRPLCCQKTIHELHELHELHEIHEDAALFDYDVSSVASNLISVAADVFCTTSTGTRHASVLMKQVPVLSSRQ